MTKKFSRIKECLEIWRFFIVDLYYCYLYISWAFLRNESIQIVSYFFGVFGFLAVSSFLSYRLKDTVIHEYSYYVAWISLSVFCRHWLASQSQLARIPPQYISGQSPPTEGQRIFVRGHRPLLRLSPLCSLDPSRCCPYDRGPTPRL